MTSTVSNPLEGTSVPTKSSAISENRSFGMGRGCKNPAGACVEDLFRAQEVQDLM